MKNQVLLICFIEFFVVKYLKQTEFGEEKMKFIILDEEALIVKDALSEENIESLKAFIKAGIEVAVLTHKSYYEIKKYFNRVLHGITFVCDDGGMVIKNGVLYHMGVIDRKTFGEFAAIASRLKDSELYLTLKEKALKIVGENAGSIVSVKEEISKITMYSENSGAAFLDITPNLHKNNLRISYYNENVLEMTEINSTRVAAAEMLLRRFGLFKHETVAFLANDASIGLLNLFKDVTVDKASSIELKKTGAKIVDSLEAELMELSKQYIKQS